MHEVVFTPAAVLSLLTQIDELKEYNIQIHDNVDGKLQVVIGDSAYNINTTDVTDVIIDESAVAAVEDANEDGYDALAESDEIELLPVNGGVLKQIAKTLLVGGLVRLTSKLLK